MNKLAHLINTLPYTELVKLQKDLRGGNLDRLLNKRLDELKPTESGYCPVCHAETDPDENLTLTFGTKDFRQRATFDGTDCLKYFAEQLKKKQEKE
jgi:hypothetical protein